ncbi:sulfurtransferase [Acaryochloris sp. IP29b_bin.148]|uniref:sulfurtransferase n=1 Tax=Acaryochloris sp. IP29b_bin.148 TaxID=2969218 RepID=UPI00262C3465|nr:rhodanese-like domain-containing protein [Acaryochloris sp. IP29b_bin.148]
MLNPSSHSLGDSPLISADQCLNLIHEPAVKIFDVRGKWGSSSTEASADYRKGHIPGAVFLDWRAHFLELDRPTHLAPVASQKYANMSFQILGISSEDLVILYDDYHHMLASRIWWAMRYWGFTNVKILNGGWEDWCRKRLPYSSAHKYPPHGNFKATEQSYLRVSLETLLKTKDESNLIDARGMQSHRGNTDDDRSGHIPEAINIPFREVLNEETGYFKESFELEALFSQKLPDFRNSPIISSCGSGYAGTIILVALYEIGIEAPLFDDSFSVWKLNESLPVEKGITDMVSV